eukprot:1161112-Pelagomonas_calceolata.AAC.2
MTFEQFICLHILNMHLDARMQHVHPETICHTDTMLAGRKELRGSHGVWARLQGSEWACLRASMFFYLICCSAGTPSTAPYYLLCHVVQQIFSLLLLVINNLFLLLLFDLLILKQSWALSGLIRLCTSITGTWVSFATFYSTQHSYCLRPSPLLMHWILTIFQNFGAQGKMVLR